MSSTKIITPHNQEDLLVGWQINGGARPSTPSAGEWRQHQRPQRKASQSHGAKHNKEGDLRVILHAHLVTSLTGLRPLSS